MRVKAAPFTVAGGFGAAAAGVYGNPGTFPTETYGNANYFVDPIFSTTDTSPLTLVGADAAGRRDERAASHHGDGDVLPRGHRGARRRSR